MGMTVVDNLNAAASNKMSGIGFVGLNDEPVNLLCSYIEGFVVGYMYAT